MRALEGGQGGVLRLKQIQVVEGVSPCDLAFRVSLTRTAMGLVGRIRGD